MSKIARSWCDLSIRRTRSVWPVYGVNNHSGVFLSHRQPGKSFNAPYKRIRKDWFFHNPTRANVGSIGRVPAVEDDAITSPEYQVWRIKDPNWLPDFVELLVRAEFFNRLVQVHRVGTVKERLYTENLMEIPVPNCGPELQHRLVAEWDAARLTAERLEANAAIVEEESRQRLARALRLNTSKAAATTRAFALPWSKIERWGTDAARLVGSGVREGACAFQVVELDRVLTRLQYGTSMKANTERRGVAVLRMNNIENGAFDFEAIKHVVLTSGDVDRWCLQGGDVLINRTNSKELVGKCAVFRAEGTFVFASYLIRLQFDVSRVLPEYVAEVINGPSGRAQIDGLSRQIIGQANINSEEIRSLRLPLPPLAVQHELVADMQAARRRASDLRGEADRVRAKARAALEAALLGHPLPESASVPYV